MSDPRNTDPRYSDPRLSDPVLRGGEAVGGTWGWIAGVVVVALIALLVISGIERNNHTASNGPSPVTTGSAPRPASPPSTTGSGATSPQPVMPGKSGTQ